MSQVYSFPNGAAAQESDVLRLPRVEAALDDLRAGRMVLVTDDRDRGVLVMAAERATTDAVSFVSTHARGALRVALTPERFEALRLPTGPGDRPTESGAVGIPVGLNRNGHKSDGLDESTADRAATVRALADPRTRASDLVWPGQVFPVRVGPDGGLPGAGLELVALASLYPAALVCGLLEDGSGASFAEEHGIPVIEVGEGPGHQLGPVLRRGVEVTLPTRYGEFRVRAYLDDAGGQTHLALIAGEPDGKEDVLAHVHSPCFLGDVLRSLRCDCGVLLEATMLRVQTEGEGVIVYPRAEARRMAPADIGSCPAEDGASTATEAARANPEDYAVGTEIFRDMNLNGVRIVTGSGW